MNMNINPAIALIKIFDGELIMAAALNDAETRDLIDGWKLYKVEFRGLKIDITAFMSPNGYYRIRAFTVR